jgi:enterochelin esterase family protein
VAILLLREAFTKAPDFELSTQSIDSPRLAALAKELHNGNSAALASFWEEVKGKVPLIEPIPGDKQNDWVTFLYRGGLGVQRVNVVGGPPSNFDRWFRHVPHTDLWFRTENIPGDSRFLYWLHVNRPIVVQDTSAGIDAMLKASPSEPDPLNPRRDANFGNGSILELPDAPPEPWLQLNHSLPRGEVSQLTISSTILKQNRQYTLYLPPKFNPALVDCMLLVLFDGSLFGRQEASVPGPTILDNLIAQKKIRPTVAVFVDQTTDRDKERACSESFASFVADELVPEIREDNHVGQTPDRVIIGGASLGGLMASYCSFRRPDVFGNVLSISGSYWFDGKSSTLPQVGAESGWLTQQFLKSPALPIRFYLSVGRFEVGINAHMLIENRRLRDVLRAKGYSVQFHEFDGGHDPLNFRDALVDGLIALSAKPQSK